MRYQYFCNCVQWPPEDVEAEGGLRDMIDTARKITRKTFLAHVDRRDLKMLEEYLGCSKLIAMSRDWHIQYSRSKLHGKRVYFFTHSAIEYVFAGGGV